MKKNTEKKIKSALISVYYKDKLDDIIEELAQLGVQIYATGGTQKFIQELGKEVMAVEQLTAYPSILGGRVKTLHPKVFGGILGRRHVETDVAELIQYDIPEFDLVIVDLYPFEETIAKERDEDVIIEKIDIGGIGLIRAAAKNYKDVLVIASRDDYDHLLELLKNKEGVTTIEERKELAKRAFRISAHYDRAIFNYFNGIRPAHNLCA